MPCTGLKGTAAKVCKAKIKCSELKGTKNKKKQKACLAKVKCIALPAKKKGACTKKAAKLAKEYRREG